MLKFVLGIVALGLLCHFVGTAWLFEVLHALVWCVTKTLALFSENVHKFDQTKLLGGKL